MESSSGSGISESTKPPNHQLEKKRLKGASSPARPFPKDVHSFRSSPKPTVIVPKSPKLTKHQHSSPVPVSSNQSRITRRTPTGAKDNNKPAAVKSHSTKSSTGTRKTVKVIQHAAPEHKTTAASKPTSDSSPHLALKAKKSKIATLTASHHRPLSHGSPIRVPTGAIPVGRVSQTDSNSDLSDCPSEPLSEEQRQTAAASSDGESGGSGSSDRDHVGADYPLQAGASATDAAGATVCSGGVSLRTAEGSAEGAVVAAAGKGGMSQDPGAGARGHGGDGSKQEKSLTSASFIKLECSKEIIEEDLIREIEDLRSENDYLKDEVEELRAEMEEARDSYLEEEVYQVQELQRELDRSNKKCRILQYRLRKAEQKSLRVAQTGHVDGELLRNLEQDIKVAKDVSVRLHNELENVEDKRTRAEDENELLRQRIIEVEISNQALHNELDRSKETGTRRRGSRDTFRDKKSMNQEDSADLRCQLQFSKEESTLMRKKMAKLGKEKDKLEQEIQQYKSVYGDVDSPLPLAELAGGGPHSTREAELRLRLKLVEEEANILGRKIVELEVENRGLRAENDDIRCQYERDCFGREPFSSMPSSPYGGDALESAGELRRHLQFVEEEAELLRRSISEIEDHNKQLISELNRFKFGPRDEEGEVGVMMMKSGNGSNGSGVVMMEELKAARMQINELSGKVMKLQYENRVLMSTVQRCDLAQHLGLRTGSPRDSDADSDTGRRDSAEEEETGRLLLLHPKREGPVGGESDSEDLFEKTTTTSGFGSHKPSDELSGLSATELSNRRREDRETFTNVKREAERLGKTVDRLISDTESLIYDGKILITGGDSLSLALEGIKEDTTRLPDPKPDSQLLDTINTRMKAFRTELHIFMEKVDHLGEGLRERGSDRDRGDDLSPLPNLTESSSFLSGITSMSRDSPIGTLGRDLVTDFQSRSGVRDELEWRLGQERAVETQGQSQEGLPQGPAQNRGAILGHTRYHRPLLASLRLEDEERRRLDPQGVRPRGGLDLTGLQAHEAPWVQERTLLQQEVRLFRHNTIIFYMKLRWILMHWRLGKRTEAGEETAHSEMEGIPELILEHGEGETEREDRDRSFTHLPQIDCSEPDSTTQLPSTERLQNQTQVGENRRVLQAVRSLLEEFRSELREEENRGCQLQQIYANDKASWEVKWAEMKCHVAQLEEERREEKGEARGEMRGGGGDPDWAFKQEREEHRCLLAESHSTSLDLHWKLQQGEKRWGRERRGLLERFDQERQEWDSNMRNMHHEMERLQRELNVRRGSEGSPSDIKEGERAGGHRGVFSPQESPCKAPRSPRSPRFPRSAIPGPVSLPTRSHSDSEAHEEQGAVVRFRGPTENLFLDALTLDPLGGLKGPPPCRLDADKRFPCLNQALNEIPDREGPSKYQEEEEMGFGSLLRAKSVCSMSDFQRLMDSSPFLPDKGRHGDRGRDDVTPPLSPDDLKYIEEFNSKGWDFPVPGPSPTPGHHAPTAMEAWAERPASEPFQPASWFLTTSATLTTDTQSSHEPPCPPHCQRSPLRGNGGNIGGGAAVHVSHSPTRSPGPSDQDYLYPKGTKGQGGGGVGEVGGASGIGGVGGPDEVFGDGRWPPSCHKELLEGGAGVGGPIPTVGYASSLELQLSRNLSDDMKEVAFSVRNYRSGTSDHLEQQRQLRDMACQTNGFTTRGTQTTQTISVGLQTDIFRTLTSSPHRCLTPKGGSTPISSPSRNIRKIQYSPVVQSKFERPCCSPKYGSPKLQRKLSTSSKADLQGGASSSTAGPRAPTPTTPQKGASESAWARSTTTRDSPVHTTINDGLSCLFNIIDHSPVAYEPPQCKFTKSPSRSRPTPLDPSPPGEPGGPSLPPSDLKDPRYLGAVQEFLRNVRGRSPSPVQLIVETQGGPGGTGGERTPEVLSIRQDLSAPPGYTLAENAARLLNKKLLEQSFREEKRLGSGGTGGSSAQGQGSYTREGRQAEGDRNQSGCLENHSVLLSAPWGL